MKNPIQPRKKMTSCFYCEKIGKYQVGVSDFKKKEQAYIGDVCEEHVDNAIDRLMHQCFATTFWPIVSNPEGKILYHAYDADQKGLSAKLGWSEYLLSKKSSNNEL